MHTVRQLSYFLAFSLFLSFSTCCDSPNEGEKQKIVIMLKSVIVKQNLCLVTNPRTTRIHQDTVHSQNCVTNQCEVTVNNRRNLTRRRAWTRRPTTLITEWVKFATVSNTACKNTAYEHFINCALLYYSQMADHTSIIHRHPLPSHPKKRSTRIQTNIQTGTHPRHDYA